MKGLKWLLNQVRLSYTNFISKIKSFFQKNNTHHQTTASNGNDYTKKISVENKIETKGNEIDLEDVFEDALTEEEVDEEEFFDAAEDFGEQEVSVNRESDERNIFYSAKNLREVQEFIDHSNTFAVAIFEHSVTKLSGHCNDGNYQLASLQLSNDRESRACTLNLKSKQSSIKISSDHIRLYMPLYFESKMQESIECLFQYKNKNGDIIMPSIVMLLEKPDSINLNPPDFRWKERTVWNKIRESETKKSSRIPKALFSTFTIELSEGQNLNFSINTDAIPKSMEDLKDEKPTIKAILTIPYVLSIIGNIVNNILDKVVGKKEKASFHIRDILIDSKIINKSQNSKVEVEEKVDRSFKVVDVKNVYQTRPTEKDCELRRSFVRS